MAIGLSHGRNSAGHTDSDRHRQSSVVEQDAEDQRRWLRKAVRPRADTRGLSDPGSSCRSRDLLLVLCCREHLDAMGGIVPGVGARDGRRDRRSVRVSLRPGDHRRPVLPSWVALAGLVTAGLGSAPIYPAIIHSTPTTFGAHNSQAIIGIQMAAAYVGTTLAPPLFGAISANTGLWTLPLYLVVLDIFGLVMSEQVTRRGRARAQDG